MSSDTSASRVLFMDMVFDCFYALVVQGLRVLGFLSALRAEELWCFCGQLDADVRPRMIYLCIESVLMPWSSRAFTKRL